MMRISYYNAYRLAMIPPAPGEMPYFEINDNERVIGHVMAGGRLARPAEARDGEYDVLWDIIESCWATDAADRPTFSQLSVSLGQSPLTAFAQQPAVCIDMFIRTHVYRHVHWHVHRHGYRHVHKHVCRHVRRHVYRYVHKACI